MAHFLILALLSMGEISFAKELKHGAELQIQKTNGTQLHGELIAVKRNSLLIMAGTDASLDIQEIQEIRIVKKSKVGPGLLYGLLIGGGGGALLGLAGGGDGWFSAGETAVIVGGVFGVVGTVIGGTVGALAGIDETIELKGTQDPQAKAEILKKLRRFARISEEGL